MLTELANFVAAGMPGNYNALGGYGLNPYDPRRDPRPATADGRPVANTGGSSSARSAATSADCNKTIGWVIPSPPARCTDSSDTPAAR